MAIAKGGNMLISIDGIDGCGKSTQVRMLAEALGAEQIQEISPSRWGKLLRSSTEPSLAQQLAWFTADRAVLAERLEAAAGSTSKHIVSDRSFLSGVAYQSYDSGLSPSFIEELNRAIVPEYDLQIVLHVPLEVAFARIDARGIAKTWCENPGLLTWAMRVFEAWGAKRENIALVDGNRPIDAVAADVLAAAGKIHGSPVGG
jgi:dTMP kinase